MIGECFHATIWQAKVWIAFLTMWHWSWIKCEPVNTAWIGPSRCCRPHHRSTSKPTQSHHGNSCPTHTTLAIRNSIFGFSKEKPSCSLTTFAWSGSSTWVWHSMNPCSPCLSSSNTASPLYPTLTPLNRFPTRKHKRYSGSKWSHLHCWNRRSWKERTTASSRSWPRVNWTKSAGRRTTATDCSIQTKPPRSSCHPIRNHCPMRLDRLRWTSREVSWISITKYCDLWVILYGKSCINKKFSFRFFSPSFSLLLPT